MSKQLLSNVVTTFQEVAKMDGKSPSLLEVSAEPIKQNSGWSTELAEMISKLTKNLEDLHDNSLHTLTHKRDGALRDVEYQQMKISHISQKLNRTKHKLLKIQARMTAAELKIANLTVELQQARFMLHRAKDDFRRATDSLDASIFVSYAEGVDIKNQNKEGFISKLELVEKLDTKKNKEFQIQNLLAQDRARWLLSRKDEYFLE